MFLAGEVQAELDGVPVHVPRRGRRVLRRRRRPRLLERRARARPLARDAGAPAAGPQRVPLAADVGGDRRARHRGLARRDTRRTLIPTRGGPHVEPRIRRHRGRHARHRPRARAPLRGSRSRRGPERPVGRERRRRRRRRRRVGAGHHLRPRGARVDRGGARRRRARSIASRSSPSTATRTPSPTTPSSARSAWSRSSSSATRRSSARSGRRLSDSSSVVLFGGMAKERPYPGSTTVTTVNGGVVGLTRTLVEELAADPRELDPPGRRRRQPVLVGEAGGDRPATRRRRRPGRLANMDEIVDAAVFLLENGGGQRRRPDRRRRLALPLRPLLGAEPRPAALTPVARRPDHPPVDDDLDPREAARDRRRDRDADAARRALMRPGMGKVFKQITDRWGKTSPDQDRSRKGAARDRDKPR